MANAAKTEKGGRRKNATTIIKPLKSNQRERKVTFESDFFCLKEN